MDHVPGVDEVSLTTLGHALALGGGGIAGTGPAGDPMAVDLNRAGRWVVRVFDVVGHGGGAHGGIVPPG